MKGVYRQFDDENFKCNNVFYLLHFVFKVILNKKYITDMKDNVYLHFLHFVKILVKRSSYNKVYILLNKRSNYSVLFWCLMTKNLVKRIHYRQ